MKQVIIGLGEIGLAWKRILEEAGMEVIGFDIKTARLDPNGCRDKIETMHICIPQPDVKALFEIAVKDYIKYYRPRLTIIHSTVIPGTTRKIWELFGEEKRKIKIAHSPMRGQHNALYRDIKRYSKWSAGCDEEASVAAIKFHADLGLYVQGANTPEETEVLKLLDTTQYGVLITWAQEAKRICDKFHMSHSLVRKFGEETDEFYGIRPEIVPGYVGGHCLMPNIKLIMSFWRESSVGILEAVQKSNEKWKKDEGEIQEGKDLGPQRKTVSIGPTIQKTESPKIPAPQPMKKNPDFPRDEFSKEDKLVDEPW